MGTGRSQRVHQRMPAVPHWPAWGVPHWLVVFIAAVSALYAGALAVAAAVAPVSLRELLLCAALFACAAATVELTKRTGENVGLVRDVYGVWDLPLAILLPPIYVLVAPLFRFALIQWRVRRVPLHRRVFSASIVGLSYGSASVIFHLVMGQSLDAAVPFAHPLVWVLAVASAGVVQWCVNTSLLLPAIKGSDPAAATLSELVFGEERLHNDIAEFCVAVLVTVGIAVTPITIIFALPFVTLLQRSFRHAQLVNASRMDSKTGLLNAGTWEREAAAEVARAVRTRSQLAVALIDVDHFKAVNDVHGHLAGDKALQAVARTLTVFLREYDLVGRFGGEEFSLLLPQTRAVDAYRIAERIRSYIGSMPIDVGGNERSSEPVKVTVSIGVAALGTKWDATAGSSLTDLLAAADRALYQAKQNGRDQVCVITENATIATLPAAQVVRQQAPPAPARAPAEGGVPAPEAPKADPVPPALPPPLTPASGQPGN
jgi:diguanylate cyclase (GGDEF)-like protein